MKRIAIIALALGITGCANMTPAQKTTAWVVTGVVVAGMAASSGSNSEDGCKQTIGGAGADFDFYCR